MKLKSRIATALACLFAFLPLTACNKSGKDEGEIPTLSEETPITPAEIPSEEKPLEPNEEIPTVTVPEAPKPEVPKIKTADYIKIQTGGLNIRTGAGASYASLGTADKNALMVYEGREGDWYKTRYKDRTAYVNANYASIYSVDVTQGNEDVENVIKRGFDFLGVKYVLGATRYHDGKGNKIAGFTTNAFDCSSYMQYIFLHGAGKLLDVTTRTQVVQGKSVSANDIQRGDLLFFTNASRVNNTGIERVGHVALYLGDNYILHTSSDYARAEQITPARWNYFITARRMI